MKVKELIEKLQECDPDAVVTCGGPIYMLEELPSYFDGCSTEIIHDKEAKPYYSIRGFRVMGKGKKVRLRPMSPSDVIHNAVDFGKLEELEIDLSELDPMRRKRWEALIEEWKKEAIELEAEVQADLFLNERHKE